MCDCNGISKKLRLIPAILDFKTVTLCESEDTALRRDGGKDRISFFFFFYFHFIYLFFLIFNLIILKHVFPILNPPPSPYHPSGSSFLNTIYFCTESFPEFILSSAFPEVISCPSPFLDVKHLVFILP